MRVDAVAFLEVRDVLADSYDNTHSVRNRNQGLGNHFRLVDAIHNRFVAEVQRNRQDLDENLIVLRCWRRGFAEPQVIKSKVVELPCLHVQSPWFEYTRTIVRWKDVPRKVLKSLRKDIWEHYRTNPRRQTCNSPLFSTR